MRLTLHILALLIAFSSCAQRPAIQCGDEQLEHVVALLKGKRVGLLVNHTAMVGKVHVVDTLLALGVQVKKIYAPEHGFRGKTEAGGDIHDEIDERSKLPVISLYGKNMKPTPAQLEGVDVVVFDIQDVGVRFFTYISSLHYLLEACAENGKSVVILDRPNPNGSYVDGPVLKMEHKSFVGMHPIPIVHGLTVGELARMINGQGWLAGGLKADLQVVPVRNWTHNTPVSIPIRPSPNLPNDLSILLYPSTCLFEGTVVSLGRGTDKPFQIYGHPDLSGPYTFTPHSIPGVATKPPQENNLCKGVDLSDTRPSREFTLRYLLDAYRAFPDKAHFFNNYFNTLVGNRTLREQIEKGLTEQEIRATWKADLDQYKVMRSQYLLYP
ncbi:MAG: DUF1343 domain-containing protein [Cyclobacteriaceae bacterium]|nr:DUF1343 domain-containing protein [Cyclobacteriaceae bacterium]